jgi:acetylornithine deacetylase/succinyl-diaminopimelate desuccinylase-like protein
MKAELGLDVIADYINSVKEEYEHSLKQLVDIPSVSMDPERKPDIRRAAEFARELLEKAGAKARLVETAGNPVVVGEMLSSPEHPTVTIYNHIDVQPAEPSEWNHPPFDMTIENGVYRGRGSTDDKGPALAAMYGAKYAHDKKMPLNIKFIWELEEEIGSPSFAEFLKKNKDALATESVLVSDTIWVSREKPAIPYGLRGLQGAIVKLKTGVKDVHSGLVGGLARNPIGELCQVIAECYDAKTGEVKIPGFYDDVAKASAKELDNFEQSGFTLEGFKKAHELISLRQANAREGSERIWAKPTFEVHGVVGGYSGPGVKTIVPHQAEAKISMRLVPNQDPEKIFSLLVKFIKSKCPDATVHIEGSLRPYCGEFTGPYADAAKKAMIEAFGIEPAFTREGGSIGAVLSMKETLNAPVIFLGLSLPEHGYHAINENFDWQQASGGMKMFVNYFDQLTRLNRK